MAEKTVLVETVITVLVETVITAVTDIFARYTDFRPKNSYFGRKKMYLPIGRHKEILPICFGRYNGRYYGLYPSRSHTIFNVLITTVPTLSPNQMHPRRSKLVHNSLQTYFANKLTTVSSTILINQLHVPTYPEIRVANIIKNPTD